MSFMLHPLSSDLTRWHVVNSREARVRRAVFASVGVQWNTRQRGGTHWPGRRFDGGGGRRRRLETRRDATAKVLQQYLTVTESWQNRARTRNGTWSQWNAQGRARTSSDRVYRLQNRAMMFAEILSAVRGGRVDIATLATTSAAQQKRKPNWRVATGGATTDTDGGRPSRRTDGREWNAKNNVGGGGGNGTTMIVAAARYCRLTLSRVRSVRGATTTAVVTPPLAAAPAATADRVFAWRTQHTGAHWR